MKMVNFEFRMVPLKNENFTKKTHCGYLLINMYMETLCQHGAELIALSFGIMWITIVFQLNQHYYVGTLCIELLFVKCRLIIMFTDKLTNF